MMGKVHHTELQKALLSIDDKTYFVRYTEDEGASKAHMNYELVEHKLMEHGLDGTDVPSISKSTLPAHLKPGRDIKVVDSVKSGVGRGERELYISVIKPLFDLLGIEHSYSKTVDEHSIPTLASQLDLSRDHTIVVLGGDTSIYELFNGLNAGYNGERHDIDVCIVPMGTGNALAVSQGLNDEFESIVNLLTAIVKSPLPLYKVVFPEGSKVASTGSPVKEMTFCIVVSFAIHAKIVHYSEKPEWKPLGAERFKMAFAKALEEPQGFKLKVSLKRPNGEVEPFTAREQHAYIDFVATPYLEKAYRISPRSQLASPELYYVSFADQTKDELTKVVTQPYFNGAHIENTLTEYKPVDQGSTAVIEIMEDNEDRTFTCVDGVIVSIPNPRGKKVLIKHFDTSGLHYAFNIVGLQ
ncbi:uncharacterized protein CYBJADRAFT_97295 [Cyberlindnera jadinii NRRL Y-1542]|uniref:DAGKc domain-containing protein n=1 Tax=Cyberlindnera jadinii (strain ATCC 18201 / CBS 1600 / BCRC 20928 / JCM 3617 / NBRC 0987 / NRRL Y-1542) TaxID=983966 RepID=A0A1E4S0S7_CYBJN|nr:hypothetical protein CYBJADRAFT_97295 [Cyberlindnera jadinii NRRL Y-1542]ODV73090.1 hypothetical protein CYBJADRAFT_97295 [Cyberlindnera jadinii NRRL Y-1542]